MRARRGGEAAPSPFVKRDEWGGLHPGLEFRVRGEAGWYRFQAHVTNPATGEEWLDAYGGREGRRPQRQCRSFALARLARDRRGRVVTRPVKEER